jgi:hypothetical protein
MPQARHDDDVRDWRCAECERHPAVEKYLSHAGSE